MATGTHPVALPPRSAAETVAANAVALALSRVFSSALLVVWQIALGRVLGSAAYGVYGTIGALMAVGGAVTDFGTGLIVVRDVARRPAEAAAYLMASLAVQSTLALAAYVLLQGAALALGYDAGVRSLLLFVGANLLVDAVGTAAHNQLVAAERMWWSGAVGAAHVVLLVAFGGIALALGGQLWAVYIAMFAAGLARVVLYWAAMRGTVPAALKRTAVDWRLARGILSAALPLGIAAVQTLTFLHVDKLATTAMLGARATGQLTAAFVIAFGVVELLGTTVLVAALPPMSREERGVNLQAREPMLESVLHFVLLAGLPASMLIARFGSELIGLLYGPEYGDAGTVLVLMGWWIVVRMVEGALAQALTVRDRQSQVLVARAGGLIVNISLTLTLLPAVGIRGAAIGMIAGEMTIVALMLQRLAPARDWWSRIARRESRLAAPVAALAIALVALPRVLPFVAAGAAGLALYVVAAIAAGAVTREHLRVVLGIAGMRPAS